MMCGLCTLCGGGRKDTFLTGRPLERLIFHDCSWRTGCQQSYVSNRADLMTEDLRTRYNARAKSPSRKDFEKFWYHRAVEGREKE